MFLISLLRQQTHPCLLRTAKLRPLGRLMLVSRTQIAAGGRSYGMDGAT